MKSLIASLAIVSSAFTSVVAAPSLMVSGTKPVSDQSASPSATPSPTSSPSGASDPEPISDADRQLLAEMGIDSDKAMKAKADYEAKMAEAREAESKAEAAGTAWRLAEERLNEARSQKVSAESDANAASVASDQAVEDVGVIAAEMYKQGGVNPSLGALLSGDIKKIEGAQQLERIMAQQEGTVQESREKEAVEATALARALAVEEKISSLEVEARESRENADQLRADASAARDEAEAAMEAAGERAKESKQMYLDSVAESQRQMDAFAESQRVLLAEYRAQNDITNIDMEGIPAIPADSETFPLLWPTESGRITSGFGWRATPQGTIDYGGQGGYVHTGLDYGVACGTPVYAPTSGTVWLAGWSGTAGNAVGLDHGVVDEFAFATRYHHLTKTVVNVGDSVKKGQLIGVSGTTGNSNGCHLHFETIVNGKKVDPAIYMGADPAVPLKEEK